MLGVIRLLILRGRGCRLIANVHVQGVQGRGGLSVRTLWMTPTITGFLNFIFDAFQAGHIFLLRKICALCFLESKITKEIYNTVNFKV